MNRIFQSLFFAVCLGMTVSIAEVASASPSIGGVIAGSPQWQEWSNRFLRPSGRVVDTGDISHSEGQGYGMLLAVAADDRAAFDRIHRWAKANLQIRADRLFSWKWDPRKRAVADPNNAADGDILIAWALAEAADHWKDPDYARAGAAIAEDIGRKLIVEAPGHGPVLLPGAFGFAVGDQSDAPVVNLSYWIFPAFDRLAQLAPSHDWDGVRRTGLSLVDSLHRQPVGAPPDWVSLASDRPKAARRYPARSSYDALRIPLYLAMAGQDHTPRLMASSIAVPARSNGLAIVNVASGATEDVASGRGFRAIAALRSCAAAAKAVPAEFYRVSHDDAYYPATLHMLALIGGLTSHDVCLDATEVRAIRPAAWQWREAALPAGFRPSRTAASSTQPALGTMLPIAPAVAPVSIEAAAGPAPSGNAMMFGGGICLAGLLGLFGWRIAGRPARDELTAIMHDEPAPVAAPQRSPAPRCLPQNPFQQARSAEALAQRIEIAAVSSAEWQRTVAVAYVRVAGVDDKPAERDRVAEEIAQALRMRIRQSDAAVVIAPGEIAVCLSLVADARDLDSIAQRLSIVVRKAHPVDDGCDHAFGLALFPRKHGSGADCIEAARRDFHQRRPDLSYAPRPLRPKRTARASRKPPA